MNKKLLIFGAIALGIILIWGYKTMGWFGGTKSSNNPAQPGSAGRVNQSAILCSKTLDGLRMNVNDLIGSLNNTVPTAIQFQTMGNSLLQILYLFQNCVSINGSVPCSKAMDGLRMRVNEVQGSLNNTAPTAIQFQTAVNALSSMLYILQNCIRINGSVACGKAMDGLRMKINELQGSLNNTAPTAIQFQEASNALLNILYILQNCMRNFS